MSHRNLIALLFLLILATALPSLARTQTGFLDRTVAMSSTTYRYQVYVPADFSKKKSWPVILFLHGAGERGSDGLLQTDVGIAHAIRLHSSRFPFVVVIPQCGEGKIWGEPDMQTQAMAALEASLKEFHGDRNRIYLTGLSMGGFGTWDIISRQPDRFAAAVPVCGGGDEAQAPRIAKLPIWAFHGARDMTVKPFRSRRMIAALERTGGHPRYTEYPHEEHASWVPAYKDPELYKWLFAQKRG